MGKKIFEKYYEVTYRDMDPKGHIRISSYMDFMADCGLSQDEEYGFVIADLCKDNYTWMLVDYEINIYRYAGYKEKIKVVTYIEGMNKFYAQRCFEIYDCDENLILKGKTLVILVDAKKRRPISIAEEHYIAYGVKEKNTKIGKNRIKLKSCESIDYLKEFEIKYADLDLNSHVGNANYIQLSLEPIPLDIIKEHMCTSIYIKYNKELKYNEKVKVEIQIKENKDEIIGNHEIINEEGDSVALLETRWIKI